MFYDTFDGLLRVLVVAPLTYVGSSELASIFLPVVGRPRSRSS